MFHIKLLINNVKSYVVDFDRLVYSTNNKVIDFLNNNELIYSEESLQEIHLSESGIFVNTIYGKGYLINDSVSFLNEHIMYICYPYVIIYTRVDGKKYNYIKNIANNSENYNLLCSSSIFIVNNSIYYRKNSQNNSIDALSFPKAIFLWSFNLYQFGQWYSPSEGQQDYEVEQFIGVFDNKLLVLLSNFKLISIDVATGNLLNELNLADNFGIGTWLSYSSKMHLDDENKRIVWLSSATLMHIELKTFSAILIKDFYNVPKEEFWRFKKTSLHKGKLLFTGQNGRETGDPDTVGIMDPNNGAIFWQYQVATNEAGGLYEAPQASMNKLYVRDLNNVLYIFEDDA